MSEETEETQDWILRMKLTRIDAGEAANGILEMQKLDYEKHDWMKKHEGTKKIVYLLDQACNKTYLRGIL